MARGDLRLLANSLNRDLSPLSLMSQLVAESFHALRLTYSARSQPPKPRPVTADVGS